MFVLLNFFVDDVKHYAVDHASVSKWCLNRPIQAENVLALKKMADISHEDGC